MLAAVHPEVRAWLAVLGDDDFGRVAFHLDLLRQRQGQLAAPHSRCLHGWLRCLEIPGRQRVHRLTYYADGDGTIVLLTVWRRWRGTHHERNRAVTAMRRGAVDFLEKPFENDDLVKRVRQALRHVPTSDDRALHVEYDRRSALLTPREREVMDHVVAGKTSKEIGRALGVSPRTVEIHRMRVMEKMQAGSLAELVRMALTRER